MALVTTAGSASANSYADLDFATAYFANTPREPRWATIQYKEGQLLDAMLIFEDLPWINSKATAEQALEFPRVGRLQPIPGTYTATPATGDWTDLRGRIWAADAVPEPIKQAQCEMALALDQSSEWLDPQYKRKEVRTGSATLEMQVSGDLGRVSAIAYRLLRPFLALSNGNGRSYRA